jgi:nitrite reductase/ring-hydroxylating ferredoxin subunit
VQVAGTEVGVRQHEGTFYAYENRCLHQGGPACEGVLVGRVEQTVGADGAVVGQDFSTRAMHFVCPWHGFEYDLKTGEVVSDRSRRLRRFDVIQRGEEVWVVV